MKLTKTQVESLVNQIVDLVASGLQDIKKAADIYVQLIAESEEQAERVRDMLISAGISAQTVDGLELIGRGKVLPELIINDSYAMRKVIRAQVGADRQAKPFDVVVYTNKGFKTVRKDLVSMSKKEADTVFKDDGIRSKAEQRKYLEEKAAKKAQTPVRYKVNRVEGTVTFYKDTVLTRAALEDILRQFPAPAASQFQFGHMASQFIG